MSTSLTSGPRTMRIVGLAVAGAFVFGPPIALAAGVKPRNVDNRALSPAPSVKGGFQAFDLVGPWATDRLAGRGEAVRTKAWIDYHVLKEMPASGKVVRGKDGYLYLGEDFSTTCKRQAVFEDALDSYAKLAETIERSGRRAVFTLGPNKASVVSQNVPDAVPTGACAKRTIADQNAVLDTYHHPNWVGVRPGLVDAEAAGARPYSRTDTHWTTAGSAVVATALAEHLRPQLAERITTTSGTITKTGDLTVLIGLTATEDLPWVEVSTGATVTPDPRFAKYDPQTMVFQKQRWTTSPTTGLVPGKTLILGDSFAYSAMGNLRPLFADGTFLWTGRVSQEEILTHIKASDTVVIEMVQRSLSRGHAYASPVFRAKVAALLGVPVVASAP